MGFTLAEQAEVEDDDLIETPEPELSETDNDDQELETVEGQEPEDAIEVTFDDEAAPASSETVDTGLVRKLRAEIRERDARLATLQREAPVQAIEVGEKPTLEACDYDEAKFETEFNAWNERKAKADEAGAEARKQAEAIQAAWLDELEGFKRKRDALNAPNFKAAEEEVVSALSQVQQALVIKAADDSAKVIYALGRHPQRLSTLAAIQDPIKFAVAVAKLEGKLKVTSRRTVPEPDRPVRGSATQTPGSDKQLERLETEAGRTGDRSKVIAYKRTLKAKA